MVTIQVSEQEEAMILNKRAREEKISIAKSYRSKILKVAHGYREWLDKYGRGSTFSTFVDEFGYQGGDATQVYNAASRLLDIANDISGIEDL